MTIEEEIKSILLHAFRPAIHEIKNESWRHKGHAEAGDAEETHFTVTIKSNEFSEKSRIERHRMVLRQLDHITPRIHSLVLKISS